VLLLRLGRLARRRQARRRRREVALAPREPPLDGVELRLAHLAERLERRDLRPRLVAPRDLARPQRLPALRRPRSPDGVRDVPHARRPGLRLTQRDALTEQHAGRDDEEEAHDGADPHEGI
jgi:hypothetical protein